MNSLMNVKPGCEIGLTLFYRGKNPGGGAVIFEMDTGVRPALRQAGAFGESTGSKNEGSLGESMIFGIR